MLLFDTTASLRQSCDRCHRRKQRCIRSGSQGDKPCRRCKEAGEKCVYSPPLRSGRPKSRKPKDGTHRENGAIRSLRSVAHTTSREPNIVNYIQSTNIAHPTITSSTTISNSPFDKGGIDASPSNCTTATRSSTLPTSDESVDFWWPHGDCESTMDRLTELPDSIYGTPADVIDGSWPDLLSQEWPSGTPCVLETDKPSIYTRDPSIDPELEKRDLRRENAIDPVLSLSKINLQLYEIDIPKTPEHNEWEGTLDKLFKTTQSLIHTLDRLLPKKPIAASISPEWRVSQPTFLKVVNSSKEDLSNSHGHHTQNKPPECLQEKVDSVVLRLVLVCYIQVIRLYKPLVATLADTVLWAGMHDSEHSNLLPIRIGTLQTAVSPQLYVAILLQLITHHSNEIRHNIRRLAARTINDSSRPSTTSSEPLLKQVIGIDVCSEEDSLKDGLDLVKDRLKKFHVTPVF